MTNISNKKNEPIKNFIVNKIQEDMIHNQNLQIKFRFPPEPNGFLHVGHAKAICLNFGLAQCFVGAKCNLRFDDTNPTTEKQEYIDSIKEDIKWLGFDSITNEIKFSSDYFERIYACAIILIKNNKAYVCDLSAEQIREYRGSLTEAGKNSPYRNRSTAENIELFTKMKEGEFAEGQKVLRAKIDMSSGNINMRDPILYRIMKKNHYRTNDKWCVYPTYDMTHSLCDSFENTTHSLCTLEFQDHRPLYDWIVEESKCEHKPQQIEFARLNLSYTITSKRKIKELIDNKIVANWDDPRLLTLKGMRRKGYTPNSIINFCEYIGVAKKETVIDISVLEYYLREDLNLCAPRRMGILEPIRIIITNLDPNEEKIIEVPNHPQDPAMGTRAIKFSRELYIDRQDFMEVAEKKLFKLAPGKEIRLRYSYIIKCEKVIKQPENNNIIEIHCSYDKDTLGKKPIGRKVKGVIHWLSSKDAVPAAFKLYDHLTTEREPKESILKFLNPNSLQIKKGFVEQAAISSADKLTTYQFERLGYFIEDIESKEKMRIFNRTISLKEDWKK